MGRYFDKLTAPQMARFLLGILFLSSIGVTLGMGLSSVAHVAAMATLGLALGVVGFGG